MVQDSFQTPDVSQFHLRVRKVFNWLGGHEFMIELLNREECIGFGDTITEAKQNLNESIKLCVRQKGVDSLPEPIQGAQIIVLEAPMSEEEFTTLNRELIILDQS